MKETVTSKGAARGRAFHLIFISFSFHCFYVYGCARYDKQPHHHARATNISGSPGHAHVTARRRSNRIGYPQRDLDSSHRDATQTACTEQYTGQAWAPTRHNLASLLPLLPTRPGICPALTQEARQTVARTCMLCGRRTGWLAGLTLEGPQPFPLPPHLTSYTVTPPHRSRSSTRTDLI